MIMSLTVEMLCFLKPTHSYANQVKMCLLLLLFEKKYYLKHIYFLHVYLKYII